MIRLGMNDPIADLLPRSDFVTRESDRRAIELLGKLNREHQAERPGDSRLEARIKSTKTDAQALRSAVMLYVADNPRGCPTVEDLVNERYLDGSKRTADAWDTDFQITCEGTEIDVISAGPDLEFNTEDDI